MEDTRSAVRSAGSSLCRRELNVVTHTARSVPGTGAKRKFYELTQSGARVLVAYLDTTMAYLGDPEFVAAVAAARALGDSEG